MKIEILGTGCPKCKKMEENVRKALESLGKKAEVVKVTDIVEIINRGVMSTPALLVDGKEVASGRVPESDEIIGWLK